jgi:hypothetical protein
MLNRLDRVQRRVSSRPSLNREPLDWLLDLLEAFPAEFLRDEKYIGYKDRKLQTIEDVKVMCREIAKRARAGDLTDLDSVLRALPLEALRGIGRRRDSKNTG